ncbi:MAG TPA: DNRLRE domain-containing protein [Planctomycetota bacterium]|nr:DNRLRE domain-containing protein [Planctomycetota bacterium]
MNALALCLILAIPDDGDRLLDKALEAGAWANLEGSKEPKVTVERTSEGALRITFAGGRWPTIATSAVPDDWTPWKSFAAEVTVGRDCLVGFQAVQEKSRRDAGWDAAISRWARTSFLKAGRNDLRLSLEDPSGNGYGLNPQKYGKVTALEIFFYAPHAGETMTVSGFRLLREKTPSSSPSVRFKVAGTSMETANIRELAKTLKDQWTKPEPRTVDQIERDFEAEFARIKREHPKARFAKFREGEAGYKGWQDAHINSHGPDTNTEERAKNTGKGETEEAFMRHRSLIMKVDLTSIPKGSEILAARFILVAADVQFEKGRDPRVDANLWVAEPCNRPWVENEVNAYEYAKDKFWKAVGGMSYGEDPDFHPVYLAYGPGNAPVSSWDFKEAVRFWTDGAHENHGFFLHGDSFHYMGRAYCRESKEIRNRPALLVVYEPK